MSSGIIQKYLNHLKPLLVLCEPDWIRTNDLLLRRQLLYPTELPVRKGAKIAHFLAMCTPEITLFMRISLSKPQPGRADYTIQKLHFII